MKTRILAIYFPSPPSPDALPELATLLLAISPRVGIRPPHTIYLDVAPTLHLFGGEEGVLKKLRALLSKKDIRAQLALADDPATAGLLSQFADG